MHERQEYRRKLRGSDPLQQPRCQSSACAQKAPGFKLLASLGIGTYMELKSFARPVASLFPPLARHMMEIYDSQLLQTSRTHSRGAVNVADSLWSQLTGILPSLTRGLVSRLAKDNVLRCLFICYLLTSTNHRSIQGTEQHYGGGN